jgi:hypothetical protein
MKTVYIIIAFCAGLFLGHLLFQTDKDLKPPVDETVAQTSKKLDTVDSALFEGKVSFLMQNDSLKNKLAATNNLLSISKGLLSAERKKVRKLSIRIAENASSQCGTLLSDSLSGGIALLNNKTDSLVLNYERKDSLMESMIAIRDSQIILCERSYQEIKDLSLEQSRREQKLTDDLNVALKQLKRKRLQNKVLAGGMLFVSGIITTLYIKSKQ